MSEAAVCPPSPLADGPSALPSPTSSSSPVTQLAGSLDASPVCQPSWWTTVLLKVLQYIKNVFSLFCFYVLFVWKYYKPITVQYYIADCVSWGPVLCAESLSRVWLFLTPWPPGSVPGILQARILARIVMLSSRGSSQPRNQTHVCHVAGGFFYRLSHPGSPRILEWVAWANFVGLMNQLDLQMHSQNGTWLYVGDLLYYIRNTLF